MVYMRPSRPLFFLQLDRFMTIGSVGFLLELFLLDVSVGRVMCLEGWWCESKEDKTGTHTIAVVWGYRDEKGTACKA